MAKKEKDEVEFSKKGLIIFLSVIAVVLLVFFAIPFPYTATEQRIKNVPYESTESYQDKEPYSAQDCDDSQIIHEIEYSKNKATCIQDECASYNQVCSSYDYICERTESYCVEMNFWGTECIEWSERCIDYGNTCSSYKSVCATTKCLKYKKDCSIVVHNKDIESAYFNLELWSYDYDIKDGRKITTKNQYVSAKDSEEIFWSYNYAPTESMGCWYKWVSSAPTKTECETVTKYRTVTKTRTVTKYRETKEETKLTKYSTLFQMASGNVDWYYTVRE